MATKSTTLTPADKQLIRKAIGHSSQIFTATIARLYFAIATPDATWSPSPFGPIAIAFMKDTTKNNSFFIRAVDVGSSSLSSNNVVWEQELYHQFQYFQEKSWFHTFAGDYCLVGVEFASEHEAVAFYAKVMNRDNLRVLPSKNSANNSGSTTPTAQHKGSNPGAGPTSPSSSRGGIGGGGATGATGSTRKKGHKLTKSQISAPSNFKHLTHVGYTPSTGEFSMRNIPSEWKGVFMKAGVTEEQLSDKNTAEFIWEFMKGYNGGEAPASELPAQKPESMPSMPNLTRSSQIGPPSVAPPGLPDPPKGNVGRRPPPPVPVRGGSQQQPQSQPPQVQSRPMPSIPAARAPPPPVPNRRQEATSPIPPAPSEELLPPPTPTSPISISSPTATSAPRAPPAPPMPPVAPPPPAVMAKSSSLPSIPDGETLKPPKAGSGGGTNQRSQISTGDPRNAFLESIRSGGKSALKPATEREPTPVALANSAGGSAGDIASALKNALMSRQQVMRGDDESEAGEEEEGEDEW